ncbi:hypothetical protein CI109_100915 [Kwoniella shandongensis]|uniref:Uncharacterized protein n=1 Tax=Kwoniella shandongensis TaxID=1734106 RepID=A0A5M6C9W2_9TREE|nr:uncharacterized protein CI109_001381 [Kwoniella shandongensis]KAA5529979.1 hypothetical protein CI109_001381 [Kwoniella shandongensis]
MDIIHRLNPFHHRPPSSLNRHTPTPNTYFSQARPSSSLENEDPYHHPSPPSSIDDTVPLPRPSYSTSHNAPQPPPPSPSKGIGRGGHHRTPSLLRTLAHHPSLSALKGRSKRRERGKKEAPLSPPRGARREQRERLNSSKSVPRDLRLSGEDHFNTHPLPPLPSPLPHLLNHPLTQSQRSITPSHPPQAVRQSSSIRRKPPPTPTPTPTPNPDITVYHDCAATPESVKFRMKVEVDLYASERSPSAVADVDGSPIRRRYASFDGRASPARLVAGKGSLRHLSSPPPPSHPSTPLRVGHPPTTQHPHPVPLPRDALYAQSLYADSTTFFTPGDFLQVTGTSRPAEYDDGFDMFVGREELPSGTPGGKKADLRRGAFVDGAKHEKDAIRFFSRDMYAPPISSSSTDSPSTTTTSANSLSPSKASPNHRRAESSPSPSRAKSREAFDRAAKRSSSPFEIKLSPYVTKRMSLDAFGTPTPPKSEEEEAEKGMEELLEEAYGEDGDCSEDDDNEESSKPNDQDPEAEFADTWPHETDHQDGNEENDHPVASFRNTTLSSICETFSFRSRNSQDTSSFTLPRRSSGASGSYNDWIPHRTVSDTPHQPNLSSAGLPLPRSRPSSPVLPGRLLSAPPLGMSSALLHSHIEHARALQNQIDAERLTTNILRSEVEEIKGRMTIETQEKGDLMEFVERMVAEMEDLQRTCNGKDTALDQLRQAMLENEEFFDQLQENHDSLAERCADLEKERDDLILRRDQLDTSLKQEKSDNARLFSEVSELKKDKVALENDKKEVEGIVFDLRKELAWAESRIEKLEEAEAVMKAKEVETEAWKRETERTAMELKAELEQTKSELSEARATITRQQADIETSGSRHASQLENKEDEFKNVLQQLQHRDETISDLQSELSDLRTNLSATRTADANLVEKDRIIAVLRDKLELARFESNERQFSALAEMDRLKEEVEELTRMSAEREWAGRQANEMLARYMEEKRVWNEERDELIETVKRNLGDENSNDNLRLRVDELQDQLGHAQSRSESLQQDLEDQKAALQHKTILVASQDTELVCLRTCLTDAEDQLAKSRSTLDRHTKDSERTLARLREQIEELETRLSSHDTALRSAIVEAENEKAQSRDLKSRLERYLSEIDELKLTETKLRSDVSDLRHQSAMNEISRLDLEKKVEKLEEDKELLNVALESKTMELVLLQRKEKRGSGIASSTPMTRTRPVSANLSMSVSTSRVPPTPSQSTGIDRTPLSKRLASSTSTSTLKVRRESSMLGTSTSRIPLGASTRHNKVTEQAERRAGADLGKSVSRRSSLPVLIRKPSAQGLGFITPARGVWEEKNRESSLTMVKEA